LQRAARLRGDSAKGRCVWRPQGTTRISVSRQIFAVVRAFDDAEARVTARLSVAAACADSIASRNAGHATPECQRMNIEKIKVRITESGKTMDVVVLTKHAHRIQVVLGEGVHSVKCELAPTPNRTAFSGKALGREIVYERSPDEVQADLDRLDPKLKKSRPPNR
jgi:hypothetical protein